ncbi:tetraspanin-4 isoform X1 [Sus scrofa]|uniref:tetraspanin-4 isoform X1 n=1 Tax=Sus scrofa TaxID=9823 RepID=UPI000A2B264D|nr:tetraspanin-4 isoform X1 [Sus scrofa]XP_020938232.1 tetraspanin-4 isoform X1 [Sus scrofa]XP_020938233.1 tetraspanin-4 isoform X1 [Sus scrofa]XP_020938234.1 tetraspanin-4 isoform X1 [Sus scrofa]XP_020938235.1 tetraspanin-4 isoform X1 [Sus scrofa]XP_020938236.1 tetraspanin-4 isoform X1 [Sus scrofa]
MGSGRASLGLQPWVPMRPEDVTHLSGGGVGLPGLAGHQLLGDSRKQACLLSRACSWGVLRQSQEGASWQRGTWGVLSGSSELLTLRATPQQPGPRWAGTAPLGRRPHKCGQRRARGLEPEAGVPWRGGGGGEGGALPALGLAARGPAAQRLPDLDLLGSAPPPHSCLWAAPLRCRRAGVGAEPCLPARFLLPRPPGPRASPAVLSPPAANGAPRVPFGVKRPRPGLLSLASGQGALGGKGAQKSWRTASPSPPAVGETEACPGRCAGGQGMGRDLRTLVPLGPGLCAAWLRWPGEGSGGPATWGPQAGWADGQRVWLLGCPGPVTPGHITRQLSRTSFCPCGQRLAGWTDGDSGAVVQGLLLLVPTPRPLSAAVGKADTQSPSQQCSS